MVGFASASIGKIYLQWVCSEASYASAVSGGDMEESSRMTKVAPNAKEKHFPWVCRKFPDSGMPDSADEAVQCCLMENRTDAEMLCLLFSLSHLLSRIVTSKQDFPCLEIDFLRASLEVSPLLWNIWNHANNMKPASLSLNSDWLLCSERNYTTFMLSVAYTVTQNPGEAVINTVL